MNDEPWTIQLNPKLPDGTLINIRGNAVNEVLEMLGALSANSGDMAESIKLITAAGAAVNAAHPQPATVPTTAPWTPPQGAAAPAASQPGAAPTCAHGPREFKQGVARSGKAWKGWSCTQPKGQDCPMQWIN